MAEARRAAPEAPEAPEVTMYSSAPRRGQTFALGNIIRRVMAPKAIVGLVVATTVLTFVPVGAQESMSVADPLAAHEERLANHASRDFARVPVLPASLPAALYSPSAVIPSPVPSPSVEAAPVVTPSPVAAAAPAAVPPPVVVAPVETTPAVDWSIEGKDAGSRWSTASVNVRKGPGTGFDVISAIAEGRGITITDVTHDGWQQISLKSGAGWIKASFLTETEPVVAPVKAAAAAPATKKSAPADKGSSAEAKAPAAGGNCAKAGNAENGMTKRTVGVLRTVCSKFSSITSYGGYRAGSSGYHGSGQAIDAMISGDAGWDVANWVRANSSSLGVVEVIYQQKIWTSQRSGDGWRSMSSRGSASANHYDHVHISVG